jgi:SAM-dependent methyltransferase
MQLKPRLRKWRWLQHLRRRYWNARFRLLRPFRPRWPDPSPDALPVPPPELRDLVGGEDGFLDIGRLCARRIEETLAGCGVDLRALGAVLDFGCGCGRTLRHFTGLQRTRLCGTDFNPALVDWCWWNLPFAEFGLNGLEPPLDHAHEAFDLVYAFSVFTHLPDRLQRAWMDELARIIKPAGYLALSTLPESMLPDDAARRRFLAGELVVVNPDDAGRNACLAFHPPVYLRDRLATAFEVAAFIPHGVGQDFWLLRKKPARGGGGASPAA